MPRQGGDLARVGEEEVDIVCTDTWSSTSLKNRAENTAATIPAAVGQLKRSATCSLQAGDFSAAITGYTAAIAAAHDQELDNGTLAKLHSNRAYAHICRHNFQEVHQHCCCHP